MIDGDQSFLENVGHVCLSSLIKDQDAESDRARLAFVSSISHALRLPLHGLAGQLELIRGASRDLDEYLQVADVCMDSLRSTLQDAIDFYDLSDHLSVSAFSTSTVELVDLAALLQDVTTRALNRSVQVAFEADDESGVRAKPVRVILDVAARDQGWLVRANAGDLRRMVANVVANAYTYTNEGEVRVSLQPTGETVDGQQVVKISVKDTGVGMDESFLQSGQLFIPFRRADAFTPSAGLGLPIVNLLVAKYGGQIHVTSARGRGAFFSWSITAACPRSLTHGFVRHDRRPHPPSQPRRRRAGTPFQSLALRGALPCHSRLHSCSPACTARRHHQPTTWLHLQHGLASTAHSCTKPPHLSGWQPHRWVRYLVDNVNFDHQRTRIAVLEQLVDACTAAAARAWLRRQPHCEEFACRAGQAKSAVPVLAQVKLSSY